MGSSLCQSQGRQPRPKTRPRHENYRAAWPTLLPSLCHSLLRNAITAPPPGQTRKKTVTPQRSVGSLSTETGTGHWLGCVHHRAAGGPVEGSCFPPILHIRTLRGHREGEIYIIQNLQRKGEGAVLSPSDEQPASRPALEHSLGNCCVAKPKAGQRSRERAGQSADDHGSPARPLAFRQAPALAPPLDKPQMCRHDAPHSPSPLPHHYCPALATSAVAPVIHEVICALSAPVNSQLPESRGRVRAPRTAQELTSV